MTRETINVLLADDHAIVREGVRALLAREADVAIVGAGYAGLTAALCDEGLDATGVDCTTNKHRPTIPILHVDLTTEQGQAFIMRLLAEDHLMYVHTGPPCGTFIRTRERHIPAHQLAEGHPAPSLYAQTSIQRGSLRDT